VEDEEERGEDHVYVLDDQGTILWQTKVERKVVKLSISGDGSIVLAFLADGSLHAWSGTGSALWNSPCIGGPEISKTGELVACWNTGEETAGGTALQGLNGKGMPLWSYDDAVGLWDVSVADGGDAVAMVTLSGQAVVLNGKGQILWKQELGTSVALVAIAPGDQLRIALGTGIERETIALYDTEGVELWSATIPGGADSIAISRDAEFLVTGNNTVQGQRVYVFDSEGNLFWKFQLDRPARERVLVHISESGNRVMAALERDGRPILLGWDRHGEVNTRIQVGSDIVEFALSRDGNRVALITGEGKLLYFAE